MATLDPERIRLTGTAPVIDRAGPRGPHLVVVEESSSFPFPLPPQGEILIGRGTEADLPLGERAASRRHATLTVAGGQVQITDLGLATVDRIREVNRWGLEVALAGWSGEDLEQLAALFHRLVDDFVAHAEDPLPEPPAL